MCLVTFIAINGPMPRRKRQDNKYLCPTCSSQQTIVEHTDMVLRLCAIPVRRLRQGAFYLHCASCHAAHKSSKTHLINAVKLRPASPRDYGELLSTPPSPLIAAGPPPKVFSSSVTRRASAGWAPQLAPVMEGSGGKHAK